MAEYDFTSREDAEAFRDHKAESTDDTDCNIGIGAVKCDVRKGAHPLGGIIERIGSAFRLTTDDKPAKAADSGTATA